MTYHTKLSEGEWRKLSLVEQMANIGSEVGRTIKWKGNNKQRCELALRRAIELFNLTLNDPKNSKRLKEISRSKEIFTDWYFGSGLYKVSKEELNDYFLSFAISARLNR